MKKIILKMLPIVLILSIFNYMPSKATNKSDLPQPATLTIFEKYNNEKFISFVEKNEGFKISDEGIEVKETKESDKTIVTIIDKRNPDNISVISSKDLFATSHVDSRVAIPRFTFHPGQAIKEVVVDLIWDFVAEAVMGWVCNVLSDSNGVDEYCNYVLQQAIAGLAISGRYKVIKYFYKDPDCAPPHSYMCNSAPYAYFKYKMIKVYFE